MSTCAGGATTTTRRPDFESFDDKPCPGCGITWYYALHNRAYTNVSLSARQYSDNPKPISVLITCDRCGYKIEVAPSAETADREASVAVVSVVPEVTKDEIVEIVRRLDASRELVTDAEAITRELDAITTALAPDPDQVGEPLAQVPVCDPGTGRLTWTQRRDVVPFMQRDVPAARAMRWARRHRDSLVPITLTIIGIGVLSAI